MIGGIDTSALGWWRNATPGSVQEVSNAQLQQIIAAQNFGLAGMNQLLYADDKPNHKRMTRRKWWLVRKAIPLPWVRR